MRLDALITQSPESPSSGWASDYFAAHTSTAGIPGEEIARARKKP
jgi:hypothetical protein